MVLQYRLKGSGRWKKYPGKDNLKEEVRSYDFRLLSEDKRKVLVDCGVMLRL